jgi:hypothetical protein
MALRQHNDRSLIPRKVLALLGNALFALLVVACGGSAQPAVAADSSEDGNQNCCDASNPGCAAPAYNGVRVALVVGNDSYSGALRALSNGANDARAMTAILKGSYRVRCMLNLDRVTFNRELDAFRKHIEVTAEQHKDESVNARALLYFSGHGFSVDGENYIVLSGSVTDKADLSDNHARLIAGIAATIGSHVNFKTSLIFDSCRNFIQGQPNQPAFADKGFTPPVVFDGMDIVYSTGPFSFARDEFDEVNRTNTGAYAHTVRKFSAFEGLTAGQLLVSNVASDPAMRAIGQTPSAAPGGFFDLYSWSGASSGCASTEAYIVNTIGFCQSKGNPEQCMKPEVCKSLQTMAKSVPVCPQTKLDVVFPNEMQICNAVAQAASTSVLLDVANVAGLAPDNPARANAAAAAVAIQSQADRKRLASLWRPALSQQLSAIDNLRVLPGNQTALRTETTRIQQGINQKIQTSQDVLASAKVVQALPSTTFNIDSVELKVVPSQISGSTGRLKTKGPLVANCALLPCTEDFVMAQVPTENGALKGWIEADKVVPISPTCSASLEYAENSFTPTTESLLSLRKAVSKDCIGAGATAVIVAVVRPDTDDAKLVTASQRVAFVRNSLFGSSIDPDKIRTSFAKADDAGSATPITLQVYR